MYPNIEGTPITPKASVYFKRCEKERAQQSARPPRPLGASATATGEGCQYDGDGGDDDDL